MTIPRRQIIKLPSPTERMELILLGIARQQPLKTLCRQAGVSRELFYRWMRKVRQAALLALEAEPPGPRPARKAGNLNLEIIRLKRIVLRLTKQLADLRRQKSRLALMVQSAQRTIRRNAWKPDPGPEIKKNAMQQGRRANFTERNGPRRSFVASRLSCSPAFGAFPAQPTGGGSTTNSKGAELGQ